MKKELLTLILILSGMELLYSSESYMGNLGTVVVTPSRTENSINDLATNVTVITKENIKEKNAQTAAEVLEDVVGISEVSKRGTMGTERNIRIRSGGDSSKQVLVLLDGQPINDIALGAANLELISAEIIERVEVVRGPVSASWGANALGGVVNIITKEADNNGIGLHLSEASFKTSIYSFDYSAIEEENKVVVSAVEENSDGWRENSAYLSDSFLVKFSKMLPAAGKLEMRFNYNDSSVGVPGQNTTAIDDYNGSDERAAQAADAKQSKLSRYLQLKLTNALGSSEINTRIYGSLRDSRYEYPSNFIPDDDLSQQDMLGLEIQIANVSGILAGIDLKWDGFKRTDQTTSPFTEEIDKDTVNRAVFLQYTAGIKVLNAVFGLRYDDHSVYGGSLDPRLSLVMDVGKKLKLSANAGRAFRAPTFEDLYSPYTSWAASMFGPAGDTKGNEDLEPETAWGYDAGLEYSFYDSLLARLTVFRSDVENLIEWSEVDPSDTYDKWRPSNVSEAYSQGIELELESKLTSAVRHGLNYSYLESKGKGENDSEFKTLQYTNPNTINYWLIWTVISGLKANVNVKYNDAVSWEDAYGTEHELSSYTTLDCRISKKLGGLEIFTAIDNVTDQRYQTRENYPLPGRVYSGGMNYRF